MLALLRARARRDLGARWSPQSHPRLLQKARLQRDGEFVRCRGFPAAATKSSDLAIKTWLANGATSMSRYVALTGLNTGQWMFAIRFESAETWAMAMRAVQASPGSGHDCAGTSCWRLKAFS